LDYQYLLYTKEDGIGTVTINRREAMNALNSQVLDEIFFKFQEIGESPDVRVVILTGNGQKAFVAGADISEMAPRGSVEMRTMIGKFRRSFDAVYGLNKPVIAAINGFALGGGCELAMCCDLRIAADTAKFSQPEINLGLIPGAGGTQRLSRLVGMAKAKELIYLGDMIDAQTALSMGLVNRVVPAASLMDETKAIARKLLSKSGITLALAKEAITKGAEMSLTSGLDYEAQCFDVCFATQDEKEGTGAFLAKRKPDFKGK